MDFISSYIERYSYMFSNLPRIKCIASLNFHVKQTNKLKVHVADLKRLYFKLLHVANLLFVKYKFTYEVCVAVL